MRIDKKVEERIEIVCSNEDGKYDMVLYKICQDTYHEKTTNAYMFGKRFKKI